METIIINNSSYSVQRVFIGKQHVSDVIQTRICADLPQILPLTNQKAISYNNHGDCSVVRRHNGN